MTVLFRKNPLSRSTSDLFNPTYFRRMTHWLPLFLEDRDIDRNAVFRLETDDTIHFVTMESVEEYILHLSSRMQERIKEKLLEIDHYDGNVMLFFRYIAQAIITAQPVLP